MNAKEKPINELVREYIEARHVCRKIIALNMGISESKLSRLLNGNRRMTIDDYRDICRAMAVDPRNFFEKTNDLS